ncbi:MAG: heme ABC transporter permease [Proteobacteria bacterium]|nr:heme ABC transporter permease [Pseudomonadota bacterium]
MHRFANPTWFVKITTAILPWVVGITALLMGYGFWQALFVSPPDYQMGEAVRIMYVHVPAAYMAMMVYGAMAVASAVALIWRHPVADVAAKASAPIGAGFTLLALVTGMLWGQPMWGAFWVWDARLTSVLILFFIYLAYIGIWTSIDDPLRAGRAAAILALVGSVNLPIIHYSVDWWNTLHQPASLLRAGGPSVDAGMLPALLSLVFGYTTFYVMVLIWRMHRELVVRRIRALQLLHAQE